MSLGIDRQSPGSVSGLNEGISNAVAAIMMMAATIPTVIEPDPAVKLLSVSCSGIAVCITRRRLG